MDNLVMFYDVETTGFTKFNEIIEIGAVIYDKENDKIIDTFSKLIKPIKPIPKKITELTGIANSDVVDADSEDIVLNDFMGFIASHKPVMVMGHNIDAFDSRMMRERCDKNSIANILPLVSLDTFKLAKKMKDKLVAQGYNFLTEKKNLSFKLNCLSEFYGLNEQTHRALDDCINNIEVYKNLARLEKGNTKAIPDFLK